MLGMWVLPPAIIGRHCPVQMYAFQTGESTERDFANLDMFFVHYTYRGHVKRDRRII
jgi:hypothetical protein